MGHILLGGDISQVVQGPTRYVEQPAQGSPAYGNGDGLPGVLGIHAAGEAVGRGKGEASHPVVADVLLYFQSQARPVYRHFQGVIERRQ